MRVCVCVFLQMWWWWIILCMCLWRGRDFLRTQIWVCLNNSWGVIIFQIYVFMLKLLPSMFHLLLQPPTKIDKDRYYQSFFWRGKELRSEVNLPNCKWYHNSQADAPATRTVYSHKITSTITIFLELEQEI